MMISFPWQHLGAGQERLVLESVPITFDGCVHGSRIHDKSIVALSFFLTAFEEDKIFLPRTMPQPSPMSSPSLGCHLVHAC